METDEDEEEGDEGGKGGKGGSGGKGGGKEDVATPVTPVPMLHVTSGDEPPVSFSKEQIRAAFVGATKVGVRG